MLSHLLELALVNLSSEKKEKILKDLEKILDYFSQIKELKLEEKEISFPKFKEENLKEDLPETDLKVLEKLLKLAPRKEKGYFKSKPIL
ncbi:Asp-tRNA(Asn)/Glu-tRNA(Gln) amidotransferase subunit GatC [bacterium]|nr:Asp-tRNA(Asn)/Glu-tRNA(Gln) amidotransferase subunit GatC [bacterium]